MDTFFLFNSYVKCHAAPGLSFILNFLGVCDAVSFLCCVPVPPRRRPTLDHILGECSLVTLAGGGLEGQTTQARRTTLTRGTLVGSLAHPLRDYSRS